MDQSDITSSAATETEPQRSLRERIITQLLRWWWAFAVVLWGGVLSNQFGAIASALFGQISRGEAPSGDVLKDSWATTLFARNPLLGSAIFGAVAIATGAGWFAERSEQNRRERQQRHADERLRVSQRAEIRDDTRLMLQEFFQQHQIATDTDSEEESVAQIRREIVLPPRPALVVGRDHELEHIATALTLPSTHAVALRGMGGVGKSTLLLETLYRQVGTRTFPDGAVWLSCQDLVEDDGEAQLYDAAGVALGLSDVAKVNGVVAKSSALQRGLAGRRLIIALDNVEAQLPLQRVIATFTARGANGQGPVILLSSRVNWPDLTGVAEIDLDVLPAEKGLALLRQLVARSGKAIASDEEDAARAIIEAIGALPLAIELVAPRVARRAEPLANLATRLRDEGVQLKGRTRGIERTFDVTYEQLSEPEQAAFCALAVLAGPSFSQDAALEVIKAVNPEGADPQSLHDLVDLSLLREVPSPSGAPRYQMHPLLRQFAREKLRDRGGSVEYSVEMAAAYHYRAYAHRQTRQRVEGMDALELDYPNILSAVTWAYRQMSRTGATEDQRKANATLVGDISGSLRDFVRDRGYWTDGRKILLWGAEADDLLGNHTRESSSLAALGFLARQQGDLDAAERYLRQALELTRARHDRRGEAARIHNLGTLALARGDFAKSRDLYEQALTIRRELKEEGGISATLRALGMLAAEQGDWAEARRYLREALDLKRQPGVSKGRTYCELGSVLVRDPQGDREQARKLLESALEIARQNTLSYDEAHSLEWLGALELEEGHPEEARHRWESALAIYSRIGSSQTQATRARLAKIGASVEASR